MTIILGILLAFAVFLLVVLVHEFGHFFTARLTGMKVMEFGFGLPPRIARLYKDKEWTEYTVNLLPIWGFVRILWEDPTGPDARKKWAFMTRPWWARMIVLVAWVTMNFILAFVIFFGLFSQGTSPIAVNPLSDEATHSFFLPSFNEAIAMGYVTYDWVKISALSGSIAETAGIRTDERVTSINGFHTYSPDQFILAVQQWAPLGLILEKDGQSRYVAVTPVDQKIGVQVMHDNLVVYRDKQLKLPFFDAVKMAGKETYASSVMTFSFLGKLIQGIFAPATEREHEDAKAMLSWPIGVWATFVWLVEISAPVSLIFIVIALISVNLWVFNLLPIPALDGGRMVTTTLYSLVVRYRHAGVEKFLQFEKYFHAFWFVLLLVLTLYVAGLDISRFF